MVKQHDDRMEAFVKDRDIWLERRARDSRERSKKNIEHAKDIRRRFLKSLEK